jgi:lysyl-tRNA synthetase, class II
VRRRFPARAGIVRSCATSWTTLDFIEVETPMLQVIPGGAVDPKPFVTHHNALDRDCTCALRPSCT